MEGFDSSAQAFRRPFSLGTTSEEHVLLARNNKWTIAIVLKERENILRTSAEKRIQSTTGGMAARLETLPTTPYIPMFSARFAHT
jgi:hypothetical protein